MLLVFCKFTKLRDFKWCQRSDVLKIRVERMVAQEIEKNWNYLLFSVFVV